MAPNFSYYELMLISFLKESHPELLNNSSFIESRSQAAATAYADAFESGSDNQLCRKLAHDTLFSGLMFSKYDMISAILQDEFKVDDMTKIHDLTIQLQIELNCLFSQYDLTDDFSARPEYQTLYSELTGAIQEKFATNGL